MSHKKFVAGSSASPQDDPCECLRAHEVAVKLGVSREHIMRMLREGKLPGFKFGKVWLIRKTDLEQFLKSLATAALKARGDQYDLSQQNAAGGI